MAGLMLRSTAFTDHDLLPGRFARDGGNVSPPLQWSDVPSAATQLLLLVEDPDAGRSPFLHWLVTGISPTSDGMAEGALPEGCREWPNGFGTTGWGGPHPPHGEETHRYFFRLYALERPLDLTDAPQAADVHAAIAGRGLASGTMVGTYRR
ncbi:YbhB/YbcL family Raf kinase inhibitor-like protein [Micromonospora matsumotoense]|uniref:YbhB/YbcL family Raf kinase inhibitor-like protein n=1 Tax=Micromonospora matsumotoense TaxID=121616 RepID=UPI00340011BD